MGIFGRRKEDLEATGGRGAKEHTDPVCGMVVVEGRAVGPDAIQGEVHWFCSAACRDKFHAGSGTPRRQEVAR